MERAKASRGAVLASWWRHPHSQQPSGTPTEWLAGLPGELIEVHCRCSPRVAVARFISRSRHPGHLDSEHSAGALFTSFELQASFGPLCMGRVIEVDTEATPNAAALLRQLRLQPGEDSVHV